MKNVKEWIDIGTDLIRHISDRPRFESELLFCHATGLSRVEIFTKSLQAIDCGNYINLIQARSSHEPIEYLIGKASFYSREFLCERGVLIPRPETELLVDKALDLLKSIPNPTVAEIGVGSGIVAVMMAVLRSDLTIIATDINQKALDLASRNAQRFGVEHAIKFIECNLLDDVNERLDLIVSNPPYIANDYPLDLVVQKEPANALFGGENGHEILEQIIQTAERLHVDNLACETGFDQENILRELLDGTSFKFVEFYKDYANLQRGFVAKR